MEFVALVLDLIQDLVASIRTMVASVAAVLAPLCNSLPLVEVTVLPAVLVEVLSASDRLIRLLPILLWSLPLVEAVVCSAMDEEAVVLGSPFPPLRLALPYAPIAPTVFGFPPRGLILCPMLCRCMFCSRLMSILCVLLCDSSNIRVRYITFWSTLLVQRCH